MMKLHYRLSRTGLFWLIFLCFWTLRAQTTVFINEIHYDNDGADLDEGVEIAGPAGTDLTGWKLVFYNGSNGNVDKMVTLSSAIPDQQAGFGTVAVMVVGIQNGAPDGVALIDNNGNVIQFLSYEGSFTAVGGEADGMTSTDIGVSESATTPVGFSLQLSGNGSKYEDFTWQPPQQNTFGAINTGQSFLPPPPQPDISVTPETVSFGAVEVGTSAQATVTVKNIGNEILTVSDISQPGGEFSVSYSFTLPLQLAPDEAFTFEVTYLPIDANADNATIEITSDDPDTPIKEVALSGSGFIPPSVNIVINEIDSNTLSTDTMEFIELFSLDGGNVDLSGLVIVFYNGDTDLSYRAISLDGFSTDANGYFLIGNAAVPGVDIVIPNSSLQNGADAVALYVGSESDFPFGTPITLTGLIDAVVYGNNHSTDPGLLALLNPGQPQLNENANGNSDVESLQRIPNGSGGFRNTASYQALPPTPRAPNGVAATFPDIAVSPLQLGFGAVTIGEPSAPQLITIDNIGSADLSISNITINNSSYLFLTPPTVPLIIPAGGSEVLSVIFQPATTGVVNGTLSITSDDPDSPEVNVYLSGEGLEPPPTTPHNYLLLAEERIGIERFALLRGDIHANGQVEFKKGDHGEAFGNVTASEKVEVSKNNTVNGDVSAPELEIDGTVNGTVSMQSVATVALPNIAPFTPGNTDVDVSKNETLNLPPGSYADIEVNKNGKLQLSAGDYFADELCLNKNSVLEVDVSNGPVNIYLQQELQMVDRSEIVVTGGSSKLLNFWVDSERTLKIRKNTVFRGNLIAPRNRVSLEKDSYASGSICANKISVEKNVVVVGHDQNTSLPKAPQIAAEETPIHQFVLEQNYPNPFNPSTTIRFSIPEADRVSLTVYNIRGQRISTLVDKVLEAGTHQFIWDARAVSNASVSSGVYFYVLQYRNMRQTKRMLLVK
jgi:cytoskeletal protein CcmA (bactofilin family)